MIKAWFQQSFINSKKWALKYDRQWHLHESSPRPTFSLLFLFSIFLSAYGRQRFAEQIMLRTTIYRLSLLVDMLMMQYVARHCVLNNDAHPKLAMTSSYPRNSNKTMSKDSSQLSSSTDNNTSKTTIFRWNVLHQPSVPFFVPLPSPTVACEWRHKNTASLGDLSPSRRSRRRKRSSLDAQSTPSTQLYEAVLSDGHMKWKRPDFCAGLFLVVLCEFLTEKRVCVCWWRRPNT